MWYRNNRNRIFQAMTLVEVLVAVAVMSIIFAVILPQLRVAENSWDSKVSSSETLQNGRILIDHLNRNLSKAARITAVSNSSETNGYIEFIDNDSNNVRYDIGVNNYVEFGLVGNLYDLAGPVSQLLFTCYDGNDFTTPITDVNSIRYIKVETTVTNPSALDQDMTFTTQAYIRTNTLPVPGGGDITKLSEPWLEYDPVEGIEPALCKIDDTHYLCTYAGPLGNGWAVVMTVNTSDWTVTQETPFEYDTDRGNTPALCQIDATHYLCVYTGMGVDGFAVVLTVDTGNWTISKETPFEYNTSNGESPALCKIDDTHYLCAYEGVGGDGWVNILKVNTSNWTITNLDTLEFDTSMGQFPALAQIDQTHYLCAYTGPGSDGWAVVLSITPLFDAISSGTKFEFDTLMGSTPSLSKIDNTHYLCTYTGSPDNGWATVLTVDTGTWQITKETPFQFDITGMAPALSDIDNTNFMCAYQGEFWAGWSCILTVDTGTWNVSKQTSFKFEGGDGSGPALTKIDDSHYLCSYAGPGEDGFAGVLEISNEIRP